MLKETETEETIAFFVTFLSLVAFQLGGGWALSLLATLMVSLPSWVRSVGSVFLKRHCRNKSDLLVEETELLEVNSPYAQHTEGWKMAERFLPRRETSLLVICDVKENADSDVALIPMSKLYMMILLIM